MSQARSSIFLKTCMYIYIGFQIYKIEISGPKLLKVLINRLRPPKFQGRWSCLDQKRNILVCILHSVYTTRQRSDQRLSCLKMFSLWTLCLWYFPGVILFLSITQQHPYKIFSFLELRWMCLLFTIATYVLSCMLTIFLCGKRQSDNTSKLVMSYGK